MSDAVDPAEEWSGNLGVPGSSAPSWGRILTLSLLGCVSFLLLGGWDGVAPLVAVPLFVGVALGLTSGSRLEAGVAALFSSLSGAALSLWLYSPRFQSVAFNGRPVWGNRDVFMTVYDDIVLPFLKGGPAYHAANGELNVWLYVAVSVAGVALFSLLAFELHRPQVPRWGRLAAGWGIVAVLAISLVVSLSTHNAFTLAAMRGTTDPAIGYNADPTLNVRTYFFMAEGLGFYPAYVKAHELDARGLAKIRDGKFVGGPASMMRQPAMFFLWKVVAPGGRVELILWTAYLMAGLVFAGVFWSLSAMVGYRALFVCFTLFPALLLHAAGGNPLYPEWWALLAMLAGFFALVRGHWVAAGVLGLLAVLFRETFGVWLLSLALGAAVLALGDRRMWRRVAAYAGMLAAGVAGYLTHVAAGSRYVVDEKAGVLGGYLQGAAARDTALRIIAPAAYLMYPYGFFKLIPLVFMPLGVLGLWVGLRRAPLARVSTTIYALLFSVYFVTIGATSQYWGQAIMPMLIMGTALLLASLDSLGSRSAWLLRLTQPQPAATLAVGVPDTEESS